MYGQYSYPINRQQGYGAYPAPLNGRIVTGLEEARASQIPLDGTISYFPSPAENVIYAKFLDMNGLPVFLTYVPKTINNETKETAKPDFENRLLELEKKVKELMNHGTNGIDESNK